jgi:hypothetical protein
VPSCSGEIHQDKVRTATAKLESYRESAFGIERHRNRRLADLTADWFFADQQTIVFKLLHDY